MAAPSHQSAVPPPTPASFMWTRRGLFALLQLLHWMTDKWIAADAGPARH
jgi:hypothetical protein